MFMGRLVINIIVGVGREIQNIIVFIFSDGDVVNSLNNLDDRRDNLDDYSVNKFIIIYLEIQEFYLIYLVGKGKKFKSRCVLLICI